MATKKYVWGLILLSIPILGFLYYATSPLFRTVTLDEPLPGTERDIREGEMLPAETLASPGGAPVMGTLGHPAEGSARIIEAGDKKYLRYEDFKTINGPDLFVYLAKDTEAKDFVNLGPLKATEGNVNYEIPGGVDPSQYPYALTWCRAFGVLFNHADLATLTI